MHDAPFFKNVLGMSRTNLGSGTLISLGLFPEQEDSVGLVHLLVELVVRTSLGLSLNQNFVHLDLLSILEYDEYMSHCTIKLLYKIEN